MSRDVQMPLSIDEIAIPEGRRAINPAKVRALAESIEEVGLRHPITVRRKGDGYVLVAGLHRIEACRKLGREHVPSTIVTMTNAEARKWEIAENLHRADLTKLERDQMVAEWIRLTEVSGQNDHKPKGGRPEGGVSAAARELGIERKDAERAVKVDSITDEAKEAARETGLDDNRSALLQVARQPPEQQVATVHDLSERRTQRDWRDSFERLWARASEEDRSWARDFIDKPIMDHRFGA